MKCTRTETLSEHSLDTAIITHALITIANKRLGQELNPQYAITCAMYHDCSEIITGDLPTPIKYHDPNIKEAYKSIEKQATKRLLKMLPCDMTAEFSQYICEESILPQYLPFIKAADKLSALIKCTEELNAGNMEFRSALAATISHPALQLPAAKIFLSEFFPAYSLTLDEVEQFDINK